MQMLERRAGRIALIALVMLIACAALLAGPAPVTAQDGVRLTAWAEVSFPAAIQFTVIAGAPPDAINHAVLTVAQAGETLLAFETSDTAAYEQRDSGNSVQLIVTWTPDEPPYPRPFAPLAYEWAVETDEGARSTASGEILYADQRFTWQTAGEPPLALHWHNDRLNGAGIRAELAPVLDALREHTGEVAALEIAIYNPDAPLCPPVDAASPLNGQVFACSAEQVGRAYEDAGVTVVQRPSLGYNELRDLLAARVARETYEARWDEAGVEVPAWFATGIASLYRPGADLAALGLVRAALADDSALPVEALASDPPDDAPYSERALWRAQSAALVRYLADRNGPDAPFEMARALAEGEPFDGALAGLDNTLPHGLWDTWAQWVFFDEAERAAVWTPYQPVAIAPTAAPTRTPTATPRPTNTPTPPPSILPTTGPRVTPTVLGNFAPQVIVGQAPTEQIVTPTNTALPPGSLPSAIPRPSPLPPAKSDPAPIDTRQTLGVALLASGGVLFLVAVGLLLRQR